MTKTGLIFTSLFACTLFYANTDRAEKITDDTPLWDVLVKLGKNLPDHAPKNIDQEMVQRGMEIVLTGTTTDPDGKKTKRQSKHFLCTHCHNTVQEDPDLRVSDPDARLEYAMQKGLPFLQGTTLFGVANRSTWYNDDYQKKYGSLVIPARDTLRNAVQVCATECSQGRALNDWEMEAVLQYLWSLQATVAVLKLPTELRSKLDNLPADKEAKTTLLKDIESYFLSGSPAHYEDPQWRSKRKKGVEGNADRGKYLYDRSCRHCHATGNVTNFVLDDNVVDFQLLRRHFGGNSDYSIYNIVRAGSYPLPAYRPYMPYYTRERMSDQQIEDLAAYINLRSKGDNSTNE